MGNTYIVEVWETFPDDSRSYVAIYRGESFTGALWKMFKAKRQGYKCVKFEWR